jgi:uncharacterized membrane protein HdeD (DUF308 family)
MRNRDWNSYLYPLGVMPAPDAVSLTHDWPWFLIGGIISCVLGVFAWRTPVAASAGVATALGVILLVSGGAQLVQAFRFGRYGGAAWRVFQALLSIVGGFIMLRYPVIGIMGVGLTIIFYLFMSAASQFTMALATRHLRGSGLLYLSSLVSFVLGVALIAQLPLSALWLPGAFLAVDLFIAGITMILLSVRLKSLRFKRSIAAPSERRQAA